MAGLTLSVIAWLGGLFALAVLWPYGVFAALAGIPIGGFLAALAAGLYLAYRRRGKAEARFQPEPEMPRATTR